MASDNELKAVGRFSVSVTTPRASFSWTTRVSVFISVSRLGGCYFSSTVSMKRTIA
jgi:hypothetical protein